jgi:hypothetical protein
MTTVRYHRNPSVEVRPDGSGAIALHLDTREYFELNASAWFVWQHLEDAPTAAVLGARVTEHFDTPLAEAGVMVDELLDTLVGQGLVRREGAERRRDRVWRRLLGR